MKGAKVDIYLYDQVIITNKSFEKDEAKYLRLGATVVFSNRGEIGYDAVIKQIRITLKFSDNSRYEQRSYQFVTFINEDGKLRKGPAEAAVPVQIRARSALSRDIYFAPFRKRCADEEIDCNEWHNYLDWDKFLEKLKVGENIEVTVTADEFLENKRLDSSCTVKIDQHTINRLTESDWHSPPCWSPDEKEL